MATTSRSPGSLKPPAEVTDRFGVDHQAVGGFCACCGVVHPCAAVRRQARDQASESSAREFLVPMSRLARLREESIAPPR